jgi:hypothetical protein
MLLVFVIAIALTARFSCDAQFVEEFHAHGPTEFHDLAINKFVEMRKADPNLKLDQDSPFMKLATDHAIRRGMRKPDEQFELRVSRYSVYCHRHRVADPRSL